MKIFWLCLLSFCLSTDTLIGYQYQIAVAAIFRDEARFLSEWIEYHKLQGVEHFYLYNHLSDDNFAEVLAAYVDAGEVELYDWNFNPTSWEAWDKIQKSAYRHALKLAKKEAKWLAIIDIDEFIVPITDSPEGMYPLQGFLARYEKDSTIGGICLAWVFFGTSHVAKLEGNQLMIETLVLNGGPSCGGNADAILSCGSYKSIVRPKYVKEISSPHHCNFIKGRRHLLAEFKQAQLNHYWTRDEEFLYHTKIPRRGAWGQEADVILQWASGMNATTPYGEPILKFVPALKKRLQNGSAHSIGLCK